MVNAGTAKRTKRLLVGALACLIGFPAFVILHGLFDHLSGMTSDIVILSQLLGFLGAACFMIAVLVCPAGLTICLVAALLDRLTTRLKRKTRWILIILVSVITAVAAVYLLERSLAMSIIERDKAAGFNGSFEVVKSGLPVNWNIYHRPLKDGKAEFSIDTSTPIDGAGSVKFLVHAAEPAGGWRSPGLFNSLNAEEGRTYDVSFWLKNLGSSIRLEISSELPESMVTPISEIIGPDRTGEGEWRQFTYTYTVPSQYNNIRFDVNVVAPGTLWMDDVRIEPTR